MLDPLSRRERQIMDIVFARGRATAGDVLGDLPDPPSRTAVRTLLRILEQKGHLRHEKRGREFIYTPTAPRRRAAGRALDRVLNVFFDGSIERAVAAHFAERKGGVSADELERLSDLIRQARQQGSKP